MLRRILLLVLALAAVVTACGDPVPGSTEVRSPGAAADLDFRIPAGTADRLAHGERVNVLPRRLVARVGQVIRIRNDDDVAQVVGPFFVAAHSTMTQRFTSAGTYVGTCAVHVDGAIRLVVRD